MLNANEIAKPEKKSLFNQNSRKKMSKGKKIKNAKTCKIGLINKSMCSNILVNNQQ